MRLCHAFMHDAWVNKIKIYTNLIKLFYFEIYIILSLFNPVFRIDAHVHHHFECEYLLK